MSSKVEVKVTLFPLIVVFIQADDSEERAGDTSSTRQVRPNSLLPVRPNSLLHMLARGQSRGLQVESHARESTYVKVQAGVVQGLMSKYTGDTCILVGGVGQAWVGLMSGWGCRIYGFIDRAAWLH